MFPYPIDTCPQCNRPPGDEPNGCPLFVPGDRDASFAREIDRAHRLDMAAAAAMNDWTRLAHAWEDWRHLMREGGSRLTSTLPVAREFRAVDALLVFVQRCRRS